MNKEVSSGFHVSKVCFEFLNLIIKVNRYQNKDGNKTFLCYWSALVLPQHLEKWICIFIRKPLLFRQRVSFETLFEIQDVMNLSNSDCAARYDVTNADGIIAHNPLEAHTRGTALPDFSYKIKVSPPPRPQNPLRTKTFA